MQESAKTAIKAERDKSKILLLRERFPSPTIFKSPATMQIKVARRENTNLGRV